MNVATLKEVAEFQREFILLLLQTVIVCICGYFYRIDGFNIGIGNGNNRSCLVCYFRACTCKLIVDLVLVLFRLTGLWSEEVYMVENSKSAGTFLATIVLTLVIYFLAEQYYIVFPATQRRGPGGPLIPFDMWLDEHFGEDRVILITNGNLVTLVIRLVYSLYWFVIYTGKAKQRF